MSGLDKQSQDFQLYLQSNGLAEKTVHTAKVFMDKEHVQRTDPYLYLLEYRITAVDGLKSPVQLLISRQLRLIVPVTEKQLQPELACQSAVHNRRELCQKHQKHYYDKSTKTPPALPVGTTA